MQYTSAWVGSEFVSFYQVMHQKILFATFAVCFALSWKAGAESRCVDLFEPRPIEVHGAPEATRKLNRQEKESRLFRHYVYSPDDLSRILVSESLKAGPAPYVEMGFDRKRYVDLTGVFLTDSDTSPGSVGLESRAEHFVDLAISPEIEILEIKKGIYIVPGPPGVRPWVQKLLEQADTDPSSLNQWEQKTVAEARSRFSGTPLHIPIRIQDSSLVQRVNRIAHELLLRKGKSAAERDLSYGKDIVKIETEAIPARVRRLEIWDVQGQIFRHYTSQNQIEVISRDSILKAGPTPYVESQGERFRITYSALKGVFLTSPSYSPKQVGVFHQPYIEFTIDSKMPVLELEPGIFLIPSGGEPLSIPIKIINRGLL